MHVAVIDIGKPGKNLGWAVQGPQFNDQGGDLDACIEVIAKALEVGVVALGFEAALFVPMRASPAELTKARVGKCVNGISRPFSAGAGASVLVTALVVVPYVLTELRNRVRSATAVLDWRTPL